MRAHRAGGSAHPSANERDVRCRRACTVIENGQVSAYRAKVGISFKLEAGPTS